jgi:hypothetical protein
MVVAQLVLTGLVTHFASLSVRPLVTAAAAAISMMVLAAFLGIPRRPKVTAIILSTVISVVCVYWWRRLLDPLGFIGSVPASLEIPALAVIAVSIRATINTIRPIIRDWLNWPVRPTNRKC